jgi:hypothetical protein
MNIYGVLLGPSLSSTPHNQPPNTRAIICNPNSAFARTAAAKRTTKKKTSLHDADSLARFLGFCASAVRLGRASLRTLWSFSAGFPFGQSKFIRRRISAELRHDLTWRRDLLPQWNGVCFDTAVRPVMSLFTDASGIGLGGFYIRGSEPFDSRLVPLNHAFAVPLPHSGPIPIRDGGYKFALQLWGPLWASSTVRVFTDNTTSALGLLKQTLKSPANTPYGRHSHDICIIEPSWIEGLKIH